MASDVEIREERLEQIKKRLLAGDKEYGVAFRELFSAKIREAVVQKNLVATVGNLSFVVARDKTTKNLTSAQIKTLAQFFDLSTELPVQELDKQICEKCADYQKPIVATNAQGVAEITSSAKLDYEKAVLQINQLQKDLRYALEQESGVPVERSNAKPKIVATKMLKNGDAVRVLAKGDELARVKQIFAEKGIRLTHLKPKKTNSAVRQKPGTKYMYVQDLTLQDGSRIRVSADREHFDQVQDLIDSNAFGFRQDVASEQQIPSAKHATQAEQAPQMEEQVSQPKADSKPVVDAEPVQKPQAEQERVTTDEWPWPTPKIDLGVVNFGKPIIDEPQAEQAPAPQAGAQDAPKPVPMPKGPTIMISPITGETYEVKPEQEQVPETVPQPSPQPAPQPEPQPEPQPAPTAMPTPPAPVSPAPVAQPEQAKPVEPQPRIGMKNPYKQAIEFIKKQPKRFVNNMLGIALASILGFVFAGPLGLLAGLAISTVVAVGLKNLFRAVVYPFVAIGRWFNKKVLEIRDLTKEEKAELKAQKKQKRKERKERKRKEAQERKQKQKERKQKQKERKKPKAPMAEKPHAKPTAPVRAPKPEEINPKPEDSNPRRLSPEEELRFIQDLINPPKPEQENKPKTNFADSKNPEAQDQFVPKA